MTSFELTFQMTSSLMHKDDMVQILEWLFNEVHPYDPSSNKQPEVSDANNLLLWLLRTHLFEQGPNSSHDANEVAIKTLAAELVRLHTKKIQPRVRDRRISAELKANKIPAKALVGACLFTFHMPR
jgi:hypothetical protein